MVQTYGKTEQNGSINSFILHKYSLSYIVWKVESGKWKVESGKWKVESGKWKVRMALSLTPFNQEVKRP
jgi:hypothetical protein